MIRFEDVAHRGVMMGFEGDEVPSDALDKIYRVLTPYVRKLPEAYTHEVLLRPSASEQFDDLVLWMKEDERTQEGLTLEAVCCYAITEMIETVFAGYRQYEQALLTSEAHADPQTHMFVTQSMLNCFALAQELRMYIHYPVFSTIADAEIKGMEQQLSTAAGGTSH
jgi:hypothetical protein